MLDSSNAGSPAQPLKALHYKHYVQKQLVFAAAGNPNKCTMYCIRRPYISQE